MARIGVYGLKARPGGLRGGNGGANRFWRVPAAVGWIAGIYVIWLWRIFRSSDHTHIAALGLACTDRVSRRFLSGGIQRAVPAIRRGGVNPKSASGALRVLVVGVRRFSACRLDGGNSELSKGEIRRSIFRSANQTIRARLSVYEQLRRAVGRNGSRGAFRGEAISVRPDAHSKPSVQFRPRSSSGLVHRR